MAFVVSGIFRNTVVFINQSGVANPRKSHLRISGLISVYRYNTVNLSVELVSEKNKVNDRDLAVVVHISILLA